MSTLNHAKYGRLCADALPALLQKLVQERTPQTHIRKLAEFFHVSPALFLEG